MKQIEKGVVTQAFMHFHVFTFASFQVFLINWQTFSNVNDTLLCNTRFHIIHNFYSELKALVLIANL